MDRRNADDESSTACLTEHGFLRASQEARRFPVLAELVAVTVAINDAPTGDLVFEDEVFDLDRLRDALQIEVMRRLAETEPLPMFQLGPESWNGEDRAPWWCAILPGHVRGTPPDLG